MAFLVVATCLGAVWSAGSLISHEAPAPTLRPNLDPANLTILPYPGLDSIVYDPANQQMYSIGYDTVLGPSVVTIFNASSGQFFENVTDGSWGTPDPYASGLALDPSHSKLIIEEGERLAQLRTTTDTDLPAHDYIHHCFGPRAPVYDPVDQQLFAYCSPAISEIGSASLDWRLGIPAPGYVVAGDFAPAVDTATGNLYAPAVHLAGQGVLEWGVLVIDPVTRSVVTFINVTADAALAPQGAIYDPGTGLVYAKGDQLNQQNISVIDPANESIVGEIPVVDPTAMILLGPTNVLAVLTTGPLGLSNVTFVNATSFSIVGNTTLADLPIAAEGLGYDPATNLVWVTCFDGVYLVPAMS
jgi:hypothetical protein